eukprot:g19441.t1
MAFEKERVCLKRALRLYLQQAPLDVLVAELKASAAQALNTADQDALPPSWTSLDFQERVAEEVLYNHVAKEFPPRLEYVSRVTKILLEAVEAAGDEPSEGLLLARVACASSLREERMVGSATDTAYESFWFPRRRDRRRRRRGPACDRPSTGAGVLKDRVRGECRGLKEKDEEEEEEEGAFFSFRVANRDNEVGLRVWEAGRALSEFCLAHSGLLEGKRVLELGAGVGMTGMAVATSCGARQVVLTDYAPKVLSNLEHNVKINHKLLRNGDRNAPPHPSADVAVRFLDWTDYCGSPGIPRPATPAPPGRTLRAETVGVASSGSSSSPAPASVRTESEIGGSGGVPKDGGLAADCCSGVSRSSPAAAAVGVEFGEVETGAEDSLGMPEVVLAADVVYDVKYHLALVGVVVETLRRCPDALVVFASTLRNVKTMAAFHCCLEDAGVPWHSVDFPSPAAAASASVPVKPPPPPPPSFREGEEASAPAAAAAAAAAAAGQGSESGSRSLWCHPGDLERVKFCVCGRGRGLVSSDDAQ